MPLLGSDPHARDVTHLLIEMLMCVAQRARGDSDQALERPIHLQDEKYGATYRQCTNNKNHDNRGFVGRTARSSRM